MTNASFQLPRIAAALLIAAAVFPSCKDDDTDPREVANDRLEGDWEVTSLTVDGVEQMQFSIAAFDMEYEKTDPFEGDGEWTLIGTDGSTVRDDGEYEIEDEGEGIEFDGTDFDLDLDGDDVTFSGIVNAQRWIIEAERD